MNCGKLTENLFAWISKKIVDKLIKIVKFRGVFDQKTLNGQWFFSLFLNKN